MEASMSSRKTWRHRGMDVLCWVLARTPLLLANLGAWCLAWCWWTVLPVRKDVAVDNMVRSFPDFDASIRGSLLRTSIHDLALGYVELLHFMRDPAGHTSMARAENLELITDRQQQGLPCLVLQGHFGSFDLIMLSMGRGCGMDLSCVVKAPADPWSAALLERARTEFHVDLIPPRQSMEKVYRSVEAGRVVIVPMDQRFNEGIVVPFLGRPALTATGLASAARRSGVPVFLVWQWREGIGRHVMHVSPAFDLVWTDDAEADIARATQQFNEALGDCIKQRPHGWLWLHKRWRM